jgi:type II secretory pathway pseudopilin PulG
LRLKCIFVVLMVLAVMVAATAAPAMAQDANKAAKQADKQANRAAKQANKQAQGIRKAPPANSGTQKMLPSSGGIPAGTVALLGAGILLVGGGLLARRLMK